MSLHIKSGRGKRHYAARGSGWQLEPGWPGVPPKGASRYLRECILIVKEIPGYAHRVLSFFRKNISGLPPKGYGREYTSPPCPVERSCAATRRIFILRPKKLFTAKVYFSDTQSQ